MPVSGVSGEGVRRDGAEKTPGASSKLGGVRLCTRSRARWVAAKARGGADADAWGRGRSDAYIFSEAKQGANERHSGLLATMGKQDALINWVDGKGSCPKVLSRGRLNKL